MLIAGFANGMGREGLAISTWVYERSTLKWRGRFGRHGSYLSGHRIRAGSTSIRPDAEPLLRGLVDGRRHGRHLQLTSCPSRRVSVSGQWQEEQRSGDGHLEGVTDSGSTQQAVAGMEHRPVRPGFEGRLTSAAGLDDARYLVCLPGRVRRDLNGEQVLVSVEVRCEHATRRVWEVGRFTGGERRHDHLVSAHEDVAALPRRPDWWTDRDEPERAGGASLALPNGF